jgi:hypothetical protein
MAPGGFRLSAYQLPVWVWPTALVGPCAIAVLRGRSEERLATGTIVLGWALTVVAFKDRSVDTQWQVLLVDTAELPVFLWLAMRSRRWWPLFAAGFKLLIVITHLAHALDESVSSWAYLTAALIWSYLALFTVAYAAWTAPRYAESAGEVTEPGATRR